MKYPSVLISEKGKRWFLSGHPWIFRSDLLKAPALPAGPCLVQDSKGRILATALYSPRSQIALRVLAPSEVLIDRSFWESRLKQAKTLRESLQLQSNARRWVYTESDGIPSFILDAFNESFGFQLLSAGLEACRAELLEAVENVFSPKILVERNDSSVRDLEGLVRSVQVVSGNESSVTEINEAGLTFEVDLLGGQKTSAFLDQRDNRILAGNFAKGKERALDVFAYQGWFAMHLARAGCEVIAVEQSAAACALLKKNAELNRLSNVSVFEANAFDFLKEKTQTDETFDLVNLDPPAFVKSKVTLSQAIKGYKEINLRAFKLLQPGGILITSSCSQHLSWTAFLELLEDAARDAKRRVQILAVGRQAADHPVLFGFHESEYLKCFFLRVI